VLQILRRGCGKHCLPHNQLATSISAMPLSAPTCSLSKGQEGKSAAIDGSGTVPSALVGPHNTAQHNKSAFSKGPLAPYSQIRHENDADVADACAAEHAYIIINVQDLSGRTHVVHAFPSSTILFQACVSSAPHHHSTAAPSQRRQHRHSSAVPTVSPLCSTR
jgi:hypothetical protein